MESLVELFKEDWFRATLFTGFGGIIGFMSRPFIMSASERHEANQLTYENSLELMRENNNNYIKLVDALESYVDKMNSSSVLTTDFTALAKIADRYFVELNLAANAVLDNRLTKHMRENSFMPLFLDAVQKSLPQYYRVVEVSSKNLGINWGGKLSRDNYAGLYNVVKKYRPSEPIPKLD